MRDGQQGNHRQADAEHLRQVSHLSEVEQIRRGGRAIHRERADLGQPCGERLAACLRPGAGPEPDEHHGGRRIRGVRRQQVTYAAGGQRGAGPQAGRQALAARLAEVGSFRVDGPATPTDLLNFGQVRDLPQVLGIGLAAVALLTIAHLLMTSVRRRRRDFAILRALGFTSWQVRGTLCWQAVTLAGIALVIGVPTGIACGRLCWQVFAHQLGITPVVAVPLAVLAVMAAGWLASAAVIAALPGEAATRNRAARVLHSE
jgi:hypothetical protein